MILRLLADHIASAVLAHKETEKIKKILRREGRRETASGETVLLAFVDRLSFFYPPARDAYNYIIASTSTGSPSGLAN